MDRSLGKITNGSTASASGPNQLSTATQSDGSAQLATSFDKAGNLTSVAVSCNSTSVAASQCQEHYYKYAWDEIGQLAEAQRWDEEPSGSVQWSIAPADTPVVDIHYRYDSSGQRVLRFDGDPNNGGTANAEIFSTLRLDAAPYTGGDYEQTATTETA